MPHTYITTDRKLAIPGDERQNLQDYHADITDLIETELNGLTGRAPAIRRIVVVDVLSESEKSALEDWLGASLVIEDDTS